MHDAPVPARKTPVTHLAKKALKMRHKIAAHHLNQLKTNSLKPHNYQLHTPPTRCVTRAAFLSRNRQGAIVQVAS
jgi:hypothetical protein